MAVISSRTGPDGGGGCSTRGRRRLGRGAALAILSLFTAAALLSQGSLDLTGTGGESFHEGDLSQGRHIVVVWATWSPRGRDIARRVSRIQSRWKVQAKVVTVNFQEDREAIDAFLATDGMPVPVFMDPEGAFAKKHGVTALPGLLVFKDGRTAFRGRLPRDPDAVIGEILK